MILAIGASLLLSACGGTSQSDIDKAKAAGASEEAARQKQKSLEDEQARIAAELKKLQAESAQAKTQAVTPAPTVVPRVATPIPQAQAPATTSCGDNVSVSSNTSCAFAANVKAAFFEAGGGTSTVDVYSPTTGRFYSMRCVAGVPTVCRGGNNAVVYLR